MRYSRRRREAAARRRRMSYILKNGSPLPVKKKGESFVPLRINQTRESPQVLNRAPPAYAANKRIYVFSWV